MSTLASQISKAHVCLVPLKGAIGGLNCNEQKVEGSGSSPQLHAQGSEGRIAERGDKKD